MGTITTIGLDIAKSVFQVHGIDATGEVVVRRRLSRGRILAFFDNCRDAWSGMEACNTSHYWARELIALGLVRLHAHPDRSCCLMLRPKRTFVQEAGSRC